NGENSGHERSRTGEGERGLAPFARTTVASGLRAVVLLVLGTVSARAAAPDWRALPPEDFERRAEVKTVVDHGSFDADLMAVAIFHETNRVRRRLGLEAFTHLAKLDEAADLKAVMGVMQEELTHHNPLPETATPAARVESVGLVYRVVAENLARLSLLNVPPGVTQIGIRRRGGRDEPYLLDTGRTVEPHTYASFAARVVEDWMNSPGHRANIVSPELKQLGCAARPALSWKGRQEQVYAVQVFFTPR
ncbi:MAG TPA: CAP domain-containing protein, partial [Lacunisphaera sp.]|nr:CAP domain-containing protein [Lacunisphaera sp.]